MNREDPLFLPDPEVDRQELIIRLICGALLGFFVGISVVLRFNPFELFWLGVIFFVSIVGCAIAAAYWGDRFWSGVLRMWRHLP
jgi:hypothetical protein